MHPLTLSFTLIISSPYHLVSRQGCRAAARFVWHPLQPACSTRATAKKKLTERQRAALSLSYNNLSSVAEPFGREAYIFSQTDNHESRGKRGLGRYGGALIRTYCNPSLLSKTERLIQVRKKKKKSCERQQDNLLSKNVRGKM